MARARVKEVPPAWTAALAATLDQKDAGLVKESLAAIRALQLNEETAPRLALATSALAADSKRPADLRIAALGALPGPVVFGDQELFEAVRAAAAPDQPVALRTAAADLLSGARLEPPQLLALCDTVQAAGPLEAPKLLLAYTNCTDAAVGQRLLGAVQQAKALPGLRPETLAGAIALVRPDIVDVSSGVESAPGIKDADLLARFLEVARDGGARA